LETATGKENIEPEKNPVLIAAEHGCYKILKSIIDLGEEIRVEPFKKWFNLDVSNDAGKNVLHLGISIT
jgi:hypothetical protein